MSQNPRNGPHRLRDIWVNFAIFGEFSINFISPCWIFHPNSSIQVLLSQNLRTGEKKKKSPTKSLLLLGCFTSTGGPT